MNTPKNAKLYLSTLCDCSRFSFSSASSFASSFNFLLSNPSCVRDCTVPPGDWIFVKLPVIFGLCAVKVYNWKLFIYIVVQRGKLKKW